MPDPKVRHFLLRNQLPHHWGGLGGFRYTLGSLNVPKGFRDASAGPFTGTPKRSRSLLVSTVACTTFSISFLTSPERALELLLPAYVSFLSDFGHQDEFVGVVHGVIAKISPDVRVIDINHSVAPGAVRSGALSLMRAVQYLPEGVALAVVDPGVGTERQAIAVQTDWGYFVGPDNGLLSPAVAMVGGAQAAHRLSNPEFVIPSAGATFDGRDRFGPAAAVLASGEAVIEDLGPAISPHELVPMILPLPEVTSDAVSGHTWWIDHFGNVQTNIGPAELAEIGVNVGDAITVKIGLNEQEVMLVETYGNVDEGALMAVIDSQGLVALSVRGGRASDNLNVGLERPVVFRKG